MALTGFQSVSATEKESANKSNSLSQGTSPFVQNATFTVTGFDYRKPEIDGKVPANALPQPVFVCRMGENDVDLFVKPLTRGVACADGTVLDHKGGLNLWVRDQLVALRGKNDGEILQALVDGLKDKTLIVDRVPYTAQSKDGRTYAASLVDIHFKEA